MAGKENAYYEIYVENKIWKRMDNGEK